MAKSVSEKMGLKEDARAIFIHAPEVAIKTIDPRKFDLPSRLSGKFDLHSLLRHETGGPSKEISKIKTTFESRRDALDLMAKGEAGRN